MKVYVVTTSRVGFWPNNADIDSFSIWLDPDKAMKYFNKIKDEKFASIYTMEVIE
jgi:hypothetical protein